MGGAAELPERSSSPLKRPASSMEPEPIQDKDVDVDMVSVSHTEVSPSPSKPEEQGSGESQDETMAESSSVTTEDTIAPWSPTQVEAHIKTIRALAEEMHTAPLEPGQEGFLVSKKWLATVLPDDASKKTAEIDPETIGPVDNSDIIWETIRNPLVGDGVADESKKFFVRLKAQYGSEQFEILPPKAWELLRQWPGLKKGQLPIRRVANNTGDEMNPNVIFEFHPVVLPVHRVWSANSPIAIDSSLKARNPPAERLICEKTSKFQTFLAQAKRVTDIDRGQRVRVWRIPKPPAPTGPVSLTPPASPDRGEENQTSPAWSQMLVEVDSFLALERDSEREVVATDKENPMSSANDPTTLGALGLTQDEPVVLEEFVQDSGWLTQYSPAQASAALDLNRDSSRLAAVHPDGTRSGRTSPGPITRGRARKSGRTLGCVGLSNLGNTCYMNSALQCVRHIEELTKYFLVKEWKKELNRENLLGHNGDVASQYAYLLEEMYKDPPPGSVSPNRFKHTIGKYAPSFSGYGQQDTQEFLGFLLDGLQEDLSRIKKKPYIEKPDSTDDMVNNPEAIRSMAEQVWDITKKRDDSVIADLFTGMYKSTLVCPDCSKVSITFDPFNTLTLPLPVESKWNHTIKFFPLNDRPIDINVELDKHASIKALKEFISVRTGVPPERLFGAEMWKDKFYKTYPDLAAASEEITTNDNAWFFELEAKPTNIGGGKQKYGVPVQSMLDTTSGRSWKEELSTNLLVPVFHRKPGTAKSSYQFNSRWQGCAVPHFIVVTSEEARSEDAIRRKVLEKIASLSANPIFQESDTAESTEAEMIGPNGSDSTSSLEGKVAARSVQGEDDLVDVQMSSSAGESGGKPADQPISTITKHVFNHARPSWIDPKKFLPAELQNLFEMSYFSENSARIPTGQQSIEDSKEYPRLSSRVVVASPSSSDDATDNTANDNSVTDAASNEDVSSDETLANTEGPSTRMTEESDEDEKAVKTLPQRPKPGRQFKPVAKGPGGGRKKMKPHKTYGKGGKKKLRQQQREEEKRARSMESEQDPYEEDEPVPKDGADGGALIRLREGIIVEWSEDAYTEIFENSDAKNALWNSCDTLADPQLEKTQQTRAKRRKNGISIEQCLDEFERDEILSENDMWYCPRCKDFRRASKKFDLWKTPDILVMHLKRFSSAGYRRDKLDVFVDYPVENLDITQRVLHREEGKQEVYDLIGVDCHFGGLGGGHYVAHAKNFFDNKWYHYNDSSCSPKSADSVVDPAAYLLFYRRRSDVPLGGPRFKEIVTRFAEITSTDESTEQGEAQGLGEGSTLSTGSSSAIRGAGASRQLSGSLGGDREMGFGLNRSDDEGIDLADNALAPKSINGISNWSFARLNEQDQGAAGTPGSPTASDEAQHESSGDEGSTSERLIGPQIVHVFPDGPDPREYSGMTSYQLSGDEDFASHTDDLPPAYRRGASREDMAQIWGEKGGVLEVPAAGESERDSEDVTEIHLGD
ncbi:uncharacterized protein B0I36DRAFT_72433 [Microdochium trichocladiopsis]|uniref:ubiquitinyl hydrolase 1 n=1 Tax=Microdochium trichocladiopsis TaxID=1682393 RepID=A0A9P9BUQ6_9PEZI|nr:uncharacterized protein B0I36DRAFT_72433 [Microdochium trichocladiopsis]KAH7037886.1 hypothetical protein B0I36DRAFT_72433 [Microdochium trichocladiopsis]